MNPVRFFSCGKALLSAAMAILAINASAPASAEPIRIGSTPTGHLMWIAEDQGYFEAYDVEVKLKEYTSGVGASQALLKGEADLINSSEFAFVSSSERPSVCRAANTELTGQYRFDLR